MPMYCKVVSIDGYVTVFADNGTDAESAVKALSPSQIVDMMTHIDVEVFEPEFSEEI